MTDTQTPMDYSAGNRARSLQISAYTLRQHSIDGGGDIEAWRLARRMRDAETLHQFTAVEQELGHYLQRNPVSLAQVA